MAIGKPDRKIGHFLVERSLELVAVELVVKLEFTSECLVFMNLIGESELKY